MSKSNKFNIQWSPSRQELIFAAVCVAVLGFFISFVIIAYSPVRNLIPGYPNSEVKYRQMQEAMRLDSLERSVFRWEIYSENLRRVINGEKPIQIDSLIRQADIAFVEKSSVELTAADSSLRSYVQEEERFEISDKNKQGTQIDGLHFFKPLNGTLSRHYETAQHPYIDITAPEGSAVKSVLDGSVIFTSWNEADNWTIVLQHQNGIISVYKHNRKLLKGTADKVSAGTTIALLGTSAAIEADDTHLHFELWKDGAPLDPETYIVF